MKKHLHLLSFFLINFATYAQVTLTDTGINSIVGESFSYIKGGYVNPGNAGANQTWNFPALITSTPNMVTVGNPGSTIIGANFPNANIAWSNTTSGESFYFKTSSTILQLEGKFENTWIMPYSNPEELIHFPFTHLDSFVDTWANQYQKNTYTFYQKGSTKVIADGYGTLITPAGTYNNVMRIRYDRTDKDSTYQINIPMVTFDTIIEFKWYQNGTHCPIATSYSIKNSLGGQTFGSTYLVNFVGINENDNSISNLNVFPNPAAKNISLQFNLQSENSVELKIVNTLGATVKKENIQNLQTGNNSINISIAELANGVYFAQIKNGNTIETKRFVVSK